MSGRKVVIALLLLAILASCGLIAVDLGLFAKSHPTLFATHENIESAIQAATDNDQILIIDLSATWCPPCREMERSTWVDSNVESWITANAATYQIDVDKESGLARQFQTQFLPTIIAVDPKRNRELDRLVGYVGPEEMLNWLTKLDITRKTLPVIAAPDDWSQDVEIPVSSSEVAESSDSEEDSDDDSGN